MNLPVTIAVASALIAAPAAVAADGFPGLPDAASYGICQAFQNSDDGQAHGNASEAPPFAGQNSTDTCEKPGPQGDEHRSDAADEHAADDADASNDDHARDGQATADEHAQERSNDRRGPP